VDIRRHPIFATFVNDCSFQPMGMGQERGVWRAPSRRERFAPRAVLTPWERLLSAAIVVGDGGHAPIPRHPGQPPLAPLRIAGLLFSGRSITAHDRQTVLNVDIDVAFG
jgi:hypothetical protein